MKDIKREIIDKAEEYNFSGVVSIFKNNTEIINESFVFRNVADGLPNEKNTKFGIASGTKLFTALGMGKLNDEKGYGCGLYKNPDDSMFYIVGGDAGVGFDSRYLPKQKININIISNVTDGEEKLRSFILSELEEITKMI